jgi:cytochrome c-type biogenesis protein CcmH/NrfG
MPGVCVQESRSMATHAAILDIAGKHLQAGEHSKAEVLYCQVIQAEPANAAAHFHLGNTYSFQGKGPQALASYRHAARLQPDHHETLLALGVALARQGQFRTISNLRH